MEALLNRRRRPFVSEINVVPYIDVMLVLLVIFIITAPLLSQGIQVKLPAISAKPLNLKSTEPIIISVDKEGRYYVNIAKRSDHPLTASDLITLLTPHLQDKKNRPLLLKGDEGVAYGKVVYAMSLLHQAGAESIGLLTQPLPEKTSQVFRK